MVHIKKPLQNHEVPLGVLFHFVPSHSRALCSIAALCGLVTCVLQLPLASLRLPLHF